MTSALSVRCSVAAAADVYGNDQRLQLGPLKVLHRHDGYISFAVRGEEDGWHQVVSIRADALDEWFPEFTQQLLRDSMVSINASYCLSNRRTDLPYGPTLHRKNTLRYLCACYCDIDYYKMGLKVHQVVGELARMREAGEIPQTSMEIDSGHGMWLLWMLHDEAEPNRAHRGAFSDNPNDHLQLYAKINREVSRRLAALGADFIHDGTRHIRIPGSFRNDTERFVEWTIHGNAERPYSYTLRGLAEALGIELRKRSSVESTAIEANRLPCGARSRGWKRCNQNRLTAVATIIDLRCGGFVEGFRNKGAFYYALALKGAGEPQERALEAVLALGLDCTPRLSPRECQSAVREAYKGRKSVRLYYQTLADALEVYPEEAAVVSQRLGKPFPAATRFGEFVARTKISGEDTRETRRIKRRGAILELVDLAQNGASARVPSFREMAAKLREKKGIEVSFITVRSDYAALGIASSWVSPQASVTGSFDFCAESAGPASCLRSDPQQKDPEKNLTFILAKET